MKLHGGSHSAEHGMGLVKRNYLERIRSVTVIAWMRRVCSLLDRNGILNQGKLFRAD
ncbi:MAG: FAD-linked oxidase C-terminal domain-containing protein [Rhodanobacter sp.]